MKYNYSSSRGDYLTPSVFVESILSELGRERFDCDVCCSMRNIPAVACYMLDGYYVEGIKVGELDGLRGEWSPLNWLNPPFSECRKWIEKAVMEQRRGNTTVALLPVRTETDYWHKYILNNEDVDINWLRKGLRFLSPSGEEMGVFKNALAVVVFNGVRDGKREE